MKMNNDDVMNNLLELKNTPKFEEDLYGKEAEAVQKGDSYNQHSSLGDQRNIQSNHSYLQVQCKTENKDQNYKFAFDQFSQAKREILTGIFNQLMIMSRSLLLMSVTN